MKPADSSPCAVHHKFAKVPGCEDSRESSIRAHTAQLTPTFPYVCVCPFFIPLLPLVSVLPPANPPLFYAVVTAAQNTTRHNTLLLPWCWRLNSGPRNCRGAHLLPEPSLKLRNSWNYTVCKREARMEGKFSRDPRMKCTK